MSSQPPPSQPFKITTPNKPSSSSSSLPDLLFTAFSLLCLFSSPKPHLSLIPKFPSLSFQSNPRRFLRIPSMSLPNNPSNPNRHHRLRHFSTPQSLSDWLRPRLPSDSFASWGVKPGTKNVHNLWLELSEGETELADSIPPVRTVHVVSVRILGKDNRVLVESRQELSDGSVRERGRPLSEKMKPGEEPEYAVIRAVKEELGSILPKSINDCVEIENNIVRIVPGSYQEKVEERNSLSYPGLPACYVLHTVDAWVDGLPDREFCTEEEEEYEDSEEIRVADKAVSVKKHFWNWVSPDSIQP